MLILMWSAVYEGQGEVIKGFTLQEMMTYILVGNFFNVLIRNFLAEVVGRDIREGRLSMFLVRPMGYFSYILSQEVGRISVSTMMSVLSQAIVIAFFWRAFLWNFDLLYLLVLVLMLLLAFFTELLLSFLVGLVAFWIDEIDGIYSTIERVRRFFSGGYFPLSLLPAALAQISFFLPFSYSFFVPAQLYLKKIDLMTGLQGLAVQTAWILLLLLAIRLVWKRGLRRYEGVGI